MGRLVDWRRRGRLENGRDIFAQANRHVILDLLLRGTKQTRTSFLALLLLFGTAGPDGQIQDPHALGPREYCLHVILRLLNTGIPRLDSKGKEREHRRAFTEVPLFECQPMLVER